MSSPEPRSVNRYMLWLNRWTSPTPWARCRRAPDSGRDGVGTGASSDAGDAPARAPRHRSFPHRRELRRPQTTRPAGGERYWPVRDVGSSEVNVETVPPQGGGAGGNGD